MPERLKITAIEAGNLEPLDLIGSWELYQLLEGRIMRETQMYEADAIAKERKYKYLQTMNQIMRDKEVLSKLAIAADANYSSGEGLLGSFGDDALEVLMDENHPKYVEYDAVYDRNVSGFYALQEGLGLLMLEGRSPNLVLKEILSGQLDDASKIKLASLAHLAWWKDKSWDNANTERTHKDAKPFMLLDRDAQQKAWEQIVTAAKIIAPKFEVDSSGDIDGYKGFPDLSGDEVPFKSKFEQMESLIRINRAEFAVAADRGYVEGQKEQCRVDETEAPDWLGFSFGDDVKDRLEENGLSNDDRRKVLVDKRGNYNVNVGSISALVTGLEMLAQAGKDPEELLREIIEGKVSDEDINFLCRFTHLTWYKDQPHKNRDISHKSIKTFDSLRPEVQKLDWTQIVSVAFELARLLNIQIEGVNLDQKARINAYKIVPSKQAA